MVNSAALLTIMVDFGILSWVEKSPRGAANTSRAKQRKETPMSSVATSTAAVIVARDTAILEPLFATLLADPAVCPKRVAAAAQFMWDVERLADGRWLVPASNGRDAYQVDPTG